MPTPSAPESVAAFTVGVDAIVVGDDGHEGLLAASLRYACRLAKALSHVLDLGELSHLETTGSRTVIAKVSWDLAGDVRLRGEVIKSPRRAPRPNSLVSARTDAAVSDCLAALESRDSVRWAALFRRDLPPLHTDRIQAGATLGQVGLRALGILGGIEAELRETCIWLGYDRGALLLAPVGAHCLVLSIDTDRLDAGPLLAGVEETQTLLAPHDLAAVTARTHAPSSTPTATVGPPRLPTPTQGLSVPGVRERTYFPAINGPALPVGPFGSAHDGAPQSDQRGANGVRRRTPALTSER